MENILVFNAEHLEKFKFENSVCRDVKPLEKVPFLFTEREPAETNESLKQIIPYCFITKNDAEQDRRCSYFVYQRTKKGGEKRLADKYSIGVGGHINPDDHDYPNILEVARAGLNRELTEELIFTPVGADRGQFYLMGGIYDDSNAVGRVHFGLAINLHLNDGVSCSVGEDSLDKGQFVSYSWMKDRIEIFENWSQIVINNFLVF